MVRFVAASCMEVLLEGVKCAVGGGSDTGVNLQC